MSWRWYLLAWALLGQLVWLREAKPHASWFVDWKRRLGLVALIMTMSLMFAFLGPLSLGVSAVNNRR